MHKSKQQKQQFDLRKLPQQIPIACMNSNFKQSEFVPCASRAITPRLRSSQSGLPRVSLGFLNFKWPSSRKLPTFRRSVLQSFLLLPSPPYVRILDGYDLSIWNVKGIPEDHPILLAKLCGVVQIHDCRIL
jgi:hypothetical protein